MKNGRKYLRSVLQLFYNKRYVDEDTISVKHMI